jgi:hypothetical protein
VSLSTLTVLATLDDRGIWNPDWTASVRVKMKQLEKNLSHCHFVHYKSHMNGPRNK